MQVIEYALKKTGMSASALCKKAGVAASLLNKKKSGVDKPNFAHIKLTALANAAGYESYEALVVEWFNQANPYTIQSLHKDVDELKKIAAETLDIMHLNRIRATRNSGQMLSVPEPF